jgi:hypothetical protein
MQYWERKRDHVWCRKSLLQKTHRLEQNMDIYMQQVWSGVKTIRCTVHCKVEAAGEKHGGGRRIV